MSTMAICLFTVMMITILLSVPHVTVGDKARNYSYADAGCNKMIQLSCYCTQLKCHAEVIVILFVSDYFIRKLLLYLNITLCHSHRTLLNVITICLSSLIRDSTQCLNINNDETIITILTQQARAKLLFFKSYHNHYLYLQLLLQIFCVMRC